MRQKRSAAWALAILLGAAVLEIRTTASMRRVLPGVEGDDYVARIRMLAEATHQFSGALSLSGERLRKKTAVKALEWQWKMAPPETRAWIAMVLASEGASITEFIDAERIERDLAREESEEMMGE